MTICVALMLELLVICFVANIEAISHSSI